MNMGTDLKTLILDSDAIERKLQRMARQIIEHHWTEDAALLIGVAGRGEEMMKRLHRILAEISEGDIHTGVIKLEKDDPLGSPISFVGMDPEAIRDMPVVLVDDVLNSGRTLIHAAKAILDHAPKTLSTAVLIDRFHRSFPIRADFCGLTLSTNLKEHISVVFGEEDAAYLD